MAIMLKVVTEVKVIVINILLFIVNSSVKRPTNYNLIDEQNGFRTSRLIMTFNVSLTKYVMDFFSKHSQVYVIYINFLKVFVRVNHTCLLKVLISFGFY